MLTLEDINSLDFDEFVNYFCNIIEDCPFVAGRLWKLRPFRSVDNFVSKAMEIVQMIHTLPISSKSI